MVTEGNARQRVIVAMDASIPALRPGRPLFRLLLVPSAGAALMAGDVRLRLDRQRQRNAGFQHGVATDLALRMRHDRIDHLSHLALALLLLLAPAIVTTAAAAVFLAAG